LVKFKNRIYPR